MIVNIIRWQYMVEALPQITFWITLNGWRANVGFLLFFFIALSFSHSFSLSQKHPMAIRAIKIDISISLSSSHFDNYCY